MHRSQIRVLQIIPQWGPGGAERLALDLALNFQPERIQSAIVSLYPSAGTKFERLALQSNIPMYYLGKKAGVHLATVGTLQRTLREFRPDVLHTHLYSLSYALLPCWLSSVPVRVHTIHNIASKETDFVRRLIWQFAFRYLRVVPVAISRQIWQTMRETYKDIQSPIVYNGVDWRQFG